MTPGPGTDERPVLSVVVFGYHNEDTIVRSVASVLEQEADDPFEVVVATSGGDRTAELVRARFPEVPVAESHTRLMPGGVRNAGMRLTRGDIVAFLEADCLAAPGWVRNRIACHRSGHAAVASAMAVTAADGRPGTAALYLTHPNRLRGHPAGPAHPYQAYGLSVTREVLDRAGPFDELLRTDEDTVMARRIAYLGYDIWFEPSVVREHIGPSTLAGLVHDQYTRGRLDSWREVVSHPPGPSRPRFESRRGARTVVVLLRMVRRALRRIRFTARHLRTGKPGHRRELFVLFPYLLVGDVAYQVGWSVDQYEVMHRRRHARHGLAVPLASGLHHRVAAGGQRIVALTFDGVPPTMEQTRALLDQLAVPAAFFVTGRDAQERRTVVQVIAEAGHIVASAGYSGEPFTALSDAALDDELVTSAALLEEVSGQAVHHVRPPDGVFDARVLDRVRAQGLEMWLWTDHPAWSGPDRPAPPPAGDGTAAAITPGSVLRVCLGEGVAPATVARIAATVQRGRAQGYRFVRIDHPVVDPAA